MTTRMSRFFLTRFSDFLALTGSTCSAAALLATDRQIALPVSLWLIRHTRLADQAVSEADMIEPKCRTAIVESYKVYCCVGVVAFR
jgi:hypothetical protein